MSTLSLTELTKSLADKHNLTQKQAREILDATFSEISDKLKAGDEVRLHGFGTFSISERKERKGRNPQTGAEILIPASRSIKFKPASALKSVVGDNDEE